MSTKESDISDLDLNDEYFWLKVCRSPDSTFVYLDRKKYDRIKGTIMSSTSYNKTFVTQFDNKKMIIYIWRIGR